jgi:hypothetical protein
MKHYLEVKPNAGKTTHLRLEVAYNKGGLNVWNYKQERRGYYLLITPVERGGNMESFVAFSGGKILLKEVSRASAKAEAEAEAYMNRAMNGVAMTTLEAERELWNELYAARKEAVMSGASDRKVGEMTISLKIGECRAAILDVMQRNHLEFE